MPMVAEMLTQLIDLIGERTGLSTRTQRRADVTDLIERLSQGDVADYYTRLKESNISGETWQALIHALTVGETYFLRDKRHFTILRENILPEIVEKRRAQNNRILRVWSVGCATGEEAYSVAIAIREFLPDFPNWEITIVGTDINQRAIDAAKKAVYRPWSFRHTPDNFKLKYFREDEDGAHLNPAIREMVTFRQGNILQGFPHQSCDLVLCRNLLMYLSKEQAQKAEDVLYQALAPGGWLLMGQAEVLKSERSKWIMHIFPGTPIYQKPMGINPKAQFRVHIEDKADPTPVMITDEVHSSYADAVKAIHADDLTEAEFHLSAILTDQPRNPHAHALLAYIFANRQAYPEAQAHLNAALKDDPLLADAHYIRALIHMEHGETTNAMAALQAVLYSKRNHALAAFTLGNLYARDGEVRRARRAWENAVKALEDRDDEAYVSDISDMKVATMRKMLANSLEASES